MVQLDLDRITPTQLPTVLAHVSGLHAALHSDAPAASAAEPAATAAPAAVPAAQQPPRAQGRTGRTAGPYVFPDDNQARAFVAGLTDRPITGVHFIATRPGQTFLHSELVQAVGADAQGGVGGVIAALTRRLRDVSGVPGANLWTWTNLPNGQGCRYRVASETQAALRRALDLEELAT